jgi:hypothetical protein
MPLFIPELKNMAYYKLIGVSQGAFIPINCIQWPIELGRQNQDSGVFAAPTGQNGTKPILGLVCSRGPWGQLNGM